MVEMPEITFDTRHLLTWSLSISETVHPMHYVTIEC